MFAFTSRLTRNQVFGGIAAVLFITSGVLYWLNRGEASMIAEANTRVFVCSETGKSFRASLESGMVEPIESPHSGEKTGWIAEACLCTATDGGEPTYVILKKRMGLAEQTYCPQCKAEVVGHNADQQMRRAQSGGYDTTGERR